MTWLLLDTSCPRAVVAVATGGRIVSCVYLDDHLKHGAHLAKAVQDVLAEASLSMKDLRGVAVGKGPGSFVGVRIAMSHGKGLCVALQIPLAGVCTLTSINPSGWAVIDARREELYVSHNGGEPMILTPEALASQIQEGEAVVGFGSERCTQNLRGPSAEGVLHALEQKLSMGEIVNEVFSLVPAYVRSPDAKPSVQTPT